MSHRTSEAAHPEVWEQQGYAPSSNRYTESVTGYRSRAGQAYIQPGTNATYRQHLPVGSEAAQYSYGHPDAGRALWMQHALMSTGAYPSQTATSGFEVAYEPGAYPNAVPQYGQHSQPWPQAQPSQVSPRHQSMMQPQFDALPVGSTGLDTNDASSWPRSFLLGSASPSAHQVATAGQPTESGSEYVVPCPYNCGTVLTGVHAVGNMTRHLKSQNCVGSGKDKPKYACPVEGCEKRYIRSDGLKVHLRKRHGVSQSSDRNNGPEFAESRYGYN
ncbi:hypothetical protein SVAN01_11707 [Stagonosporopsis vannaccii]|nr:hypothetical protein SVAN01_11707 [Stagonosporopsis vannaccii]